MPRIVESKYYDGARQRIERLGLQGLWEEIARIITSFRLEVEERRDANGGAAIRQMLDEAFEKSVGWKKRQTGDVDWVKCATINGAQVCVGVQIQLPGRSDLLVIDVAHLRDGIMSGALDAGVILVASNKLGFFLTDRAAKYSEVEVAVRRSRAEDLPLAVLALEHDGPGAALAKRRTRQGKLPSA